MRRRGLTRITLVERLIGCTFTLEALEVRDQRICIRRRRVMLTETGSLPAVSLPVVVLVFCSPQIRFLTVSMVDRWGMCSLVKL